jgi:imidazolonepropionase-like amidohydrolase
MSIVLLLALAPACQRPEPLVRPVPAANLALRSVGVLDLETGLVGPARDVLIRDGRIEAITEPGTGTLPQDALVVEGQGATLVPGLIDMHGHVAASSAPNWERRLPDPQRNLEAFLYCGVTTVLDPADLDAGNLDRRHRIETGRLPGPRLVTAGAMLTAEDGHPAFLLRRVLPWWLSWYVIGTATREVDGVEAAREAADEQADRGVDFLKLAVDKLPRAAPRLGNSELRAAVERAHERGLRAVAHIGTTADALDAAHAGIDLWAHGVYKERISDEGLQALAAFDIPMVVTMNVFESYALTGTGPRRASRLERETVDAATLASFDKIPADGIPPEFVPYLIMLRSQRSAWRDNVRRLAEAGVTILAGSDTQAGVFPGASLHRELALMVEAGLSPLAALRAATIEAARVLERSDDPDYGVVAPGKRADLLLVDGDPGRDITALENIRAVVRDGVLLERRAVATAAP